MHVKIKRFLTDQLGEADFKITILHDQECVKQGRVRFFLAEFGDKPLCEIQGVCHVDIFDLLFFKTFIEGHVIAPLKSFEKLKLNIKKVVFSFYKVKIEYMSSFILSTIKKPSKKKGKRKSGCFYLTI